MTILEELKSIKSGKKELREFGFVVGGVLLAISAFLWWKGKPAFIWLGGIGAALVILGAILPSLLLPLQKIWMGFAVVMGFIMSRVILAILFYIGFTFIGIILRLTGKDLLDRKIDRSATSYWHHREKKEKAPSDYEKQF